MGLDVFFLDDVSDRLTALASSNARTMRWAREFGADARDVKIAEAAYQAALLDVGVAFGFHRTDLVIVLRAMIVNEER